MDATEWRLRDELTIKFSKILYALKFPETLSETPTGEGEQEDRIRHYFHNDPLAYHALKALVHAAVETATKVKGQVN